jgi:hypothetical protein
MKSNKKEMLAAITMRDRTYRKGSWCENNRFWRRSQT